MRGRFRVCIDTLFFPPPPHPNKMEQTSLIAYQKFWDDGTFKGQTRKIMMLLDMYENGFSIQQLADRSKISINAVCGRIGDLRKKGMIIHSGYIKNPYTGIKNKI